MYINMGEWEEIDDENQQIRQEWEKSWENHERNWYEKQAAADQF